MYEDIYPRYVVLRVFFHLRQTEIRVLEIKKRLRELNLPSA